MVDSIKEQINILKESIDKKTEELNKIKSEMETPTATIREEYIEQEMDGEAVNLEDSTEISDSDYYSTLGNCGDTEDNLNTTTEQSIMSAGSIPEFTPFSTENNNSLLQTTPLPQRKQDKTGYNRKDKNKTYLTNQESLKRQVTLDNSKYNKKVKIEDDLIEG